MDEAYDDLEHRVSILEKLVDVKTYRREYICKCLGCISGYVNVSDKPWITQYQPCSNCSWEGTFGTMA